MSQQRILILSLSKYFGGTDVRVISLAEALHGRRDYTVAVLKDSPLHERLKDAGYHVLPISLGRGSPRMWGLLRQIIREGNYGVVDAHNPQSQFWTHLAAPRNVRRVSTMHSSYRLEHGGSLKGRAYEQIIFMNRWLGVDFIVVTRAVQDYLASLGLKNSTLIFNSVTIPEQIIRDKQHPLLQSLGWGEQDIVFITTARLEPVKGLNYLIEAAAQLRDKLPHVRYLIVGEGRERPTLETQIATAGLEQHVHLGGFRQDIGDLLRASDVFCLPSLSEGLPFALLEASAQALPLLVSKVGGMAESLEHGVTAYHTAPANPDDIAKGIQYLAENPDKRQQLGQMGYEFVKANFSMEEMIEQTLAVYDR